MKILIIGLGSIGYRHLTNILTLHPDTEIIVLRHTEDKKTGIIPGVNKSFYNLTDALKTEPDIAFLTNPSPFHIPFGIELAKHGIHLFIEKPLSHEMNELDYFVNLVQKKNVLIMVGYNLRFNESLHILKDKIHSGLIGKIISLRAEVGQYLPDWRKDTDYLNSVSARKELGGGVLLELSHEIDYARWILGDIDSVCAISGRYSDLEIDVEDIAEILIQFRSGPVGNIHLDMVNLAKTRTCQVIGTKGTLFWDAITNSLQIYSKNSSEWSYLVSPQIFDTNQMYKDEIKHFFSCVAKRSEPVVSLSDGIAVMKIISAIRKSSLEKRWMLV